MNRTIWVVEDDVDDQLLLEMILAQLTPPVTVTFFSNGEALLSQLGSANAPRLILLDVRLPGLNGLEVLQRLREAHNLVKLPVVLFSTAGNPTEQAQANALGACDFIQKSGSYAQYSAMIADLLSKWC